MATTFTIPLTTLPVGQRTFGPANAADSESSITLTVNRTVSGGLSSLTTASVLAVDVQQSDDGGVTWQDLGTFSAIGGAAFDKNHNAVGASSGVWNLAAGTSRQVQAIVTVSGPSSIAVSGSIVTQ